MSKPLYWIVYAEGREPQRFTYRCAARAHAAALRLQGIKPIIKPVGF